MDKVYRQKVYTVEGLLRELESCRKSRDMFMKEVDAGNQRLLPNLEAMADRCDRLVYQIQVEKEKKQK